MTPHRTPSFAWLEKACEASQVIAPAERQAFITGVIRAYTEEVNRRAENKMLMTGKLEGSHHAAMREINPGLGI